jgi:suppressor of fused-like protein
MDSEAPGWDAIDARLEQFYPGVEPKHFATMHRFALGGPDPLDGVSFYPRDEPVPHWHAVSYGMSELYARDEPDTEESEESEESGWGFEFSFRIARSVDDEEPPMWAANLLQNLARYVFSSGNWFEAGHHMNANGPIRLEHPTAMTALAFVEDPELGTIGTPHGRLRFLQVVGLTSDEYDAVRQWDVHGVLKLLTERIPLLITDLDRPSITDDPEARALIDTGRERDGSSSGLFMIAGFGWTVDGTGAVLLRFKEFNAGLVAQAVRDRLGHGRDLLLDGDGHTRVLLRSTSAYAVRRLDGNALELDLPAEAVDALPGLLTAGVRPVPGTDRLSVEVLPAVTA